MTYFTRMTRRKKYNNDRTQKAINLTEFLGVVLCHAHGMIEIPRGNMASGSFSLSLSTSMYHYLVTARLTHSATRRRHDIEVLLAVLIVGSRTKIA
jgi:uncharacterized membrane protein SpoIIM required for sporulation